MNRHITPKLEETINRYSLYSQDGKRKNAVCIAVFAIGNVRWFIHEGSREDNDTTLFVMVVGLAEVESLNFDAVS